MSFLALLQQLLPADLPHRDAVAAGANLHLESIVATNQHFNLTRIVEPREAVIKHILDSLLPWPLFAAYQQVVDVGSGPGFPGLPLALALPEVQFFLLESTQKKARFIEETAQRLGLANVRVFPDRAEDWLKKNQPPVGLSRVVTARAVAPLHKAIPLFAPAWKRGIPVLLYKGPDIAAEITEAGEVARRSGVRLEVVRSYELPDDLGKRNVVALTRAAAR